MLSHSSGNWQGAACCCRALCSASNQHCMAGALTCALWPPLGSPLCALPARHTLAPGDEQRAEQRLAKVSATEPRQGNSGRRCADWPAAGTEATRGSSSERRQVPLLLRLRVGQKALRTAGMCCIEITPWQGLHADALVGRGSPAGTSHPAAAVGPSGGEPCAAPMPATCHHETNPTAFIKPLARMHCGISLDRRGVAGAEQTQKVMAAGGSHWLAGRASSAAATGGKPCA